MTQENGKWISPVLSQLRLNASESFDWKGFSAEQFSYPSHLVQVFESSELKVEQTLFFASPHSALIKVGVTNLSSESYSMAPIWSGNVFLDSIFLDSAQNQIRLTSQRSPATGIIKVHGENAQPFLTTDTSYALRLTESDLKAGESKTFLLSQTFLFPRYYEIIEMAVLASIVENIDSVLGKRINEKEGQFTQLQTRLDSNWQDPAYQLLLRKTLLTLQNNWRIPAGELSHAGLFPSYHYVWFHGFWAWDSWKHAVALAQFDPELAKEQVRAMYAFLEKDGFIADCVYRDTSIEAHNFRNTKPPLSGWAIWKIFEQDQDPEFLQEMYPSVVLQHDWWYKYRDHDGDSLCEYGSTDGTLIAAKWESGMDNGVRFDASKLVVNGKGAWSLDQESVDLNSYLYAEKLYLARMAGALGKSEDQTRFQQEARILKQKIATQFFDPASGWFYDTNLEGSEFISVMGCEGWIPLWVEAATPEQARAVKDNILDPNKFNGKVPLQTMSADHPQFEPDGGYWRGPVWLDQSYFGIMGLRNYGFHQDAYELTHKLIHNAEGVLEPGPAIRENYHPITGEGLNARHFSWTAAHILMLLTEN